MSAIYDNWERLVAAVLKKEQLRQLCHAESITTSVGTMSYTSSFSPSVLNAYVSVSSQILVKRWRRSDIRHGTLATHEDSYFSYKDEMLIIYENQSLGGASTLLHGKKHGFYRLKWGCCLRIANDVAKAIANSHESLHVDELISGIGLDKMELASSIVIPTDGYCAPEVMSYTGHPSKAADVYSFGVLLIELLIGGKLVLSRTRLVRWTVHKFHEIGTLIVFEFIPVKNPNKLIEMWKMFLVAMRCVEENPKMRPEMCDVLKMMEGIKTCCS